VGQSTSWAARHGSLVLQPPPSYFSSLMISSLNLHLDFHSGEASQLVLPQRLASFLLASLLRFHHPILAFNLVLSELSQWKTPLLP